MSFLSDRNAWFRRPAGEMQYGYEEWKQRLGSAEPKSKPAAIPASRPRHTSGEMNGLEKKYAAFLELRKRTGEILDYKFEPLKLKLAPKTFYNVDFGVWMPDGKVELHETKGFWEDDARVKIKVAAAMFPWFKFVAAKWDKGAKDWKFEEWRQQEKAPE